MDDGNTGRPRARSEAAGTGDNVPPTSPTRSSGGGGARAEFASPTRRATGLDDAGDPGSSSIRRRSTAASRQSGGSGVPSLAPRTTLAQRTQGKFTLAGPEETPQLRRAHEPFVHPGYADLNPAYEQPTNAKPVWSLAKPLPRVVRPGMVPTRDELMQNRTNAQLPAENSQRMGLDVDPNQLEQGQIGKSANPRKMGAQVEDARVQRENNFLNKIIGGDATSTKQSSRMSRTSSGRVRRASTWNAPPDQLSTVEEQEGEPESDTGSRGERQNMSDEPLQPVTHQPGPEPEHEEGTDGEEPMDKLHLDEAAYPEDLHPLVQNLVEDEVHNNHTIWSVIRTHHREALAEALAVFMQLTIGFCSDLAVTVANKGNPNTTDWAWGFATMIGIYISGGVSGAHLNPTITTMLWFFRGFPKRKMPEYFAAQFLGAFCAAFVAYGLYYASIQHFLLTNPTADIVDSFVTSRREAWIGSATAFFNEFLGTAVLAATVLALGDDQNAPPGAGMNSLIIGLVITVLSIGFAYQTGAALNPSRDFGPRLALLALGYGSHLFTDPYWFYGPFAATLCGAFVGAFLYDFMIFTGGESPINYPLERTQRAMRKSRMKWRHRLHLDRGEKTRDRVVV